MFGGPEHGLHVRSSAVDRGSCKAVFPRFILSSGRLVEYEGGGEETPPSQTRMASLN